MNDPVNLGVFYRILSSLGIFISIGPIIDEVQEYRYINNRLCSKARQVLLIIWLFSAYTLTIHYKEVLIANLVNVGYEDTIDNFDDVLRSGMPLVVPENTAIPKLLNNDPRKSVQQLLDNLLYYNYTGLLPTWVKEG